MRPALAQVCITAESECLTFRTIVFLLFQVQWCDYQVHILSLQKEDCSSGKIFEPPKYLQCPSNLIRERRESSKITLNIMVLIVEMTEPVLIDAINFLTQLTKSLFLF